MNHFFMLTVLYLLFIEVLRCTDHQYSLDPFLSSGGDRRSGLRAALFITQFINLC